MKNDEKDNYGICQYNNRIKYKASSKLKEYEGFGIYYSHHGSIYEGKFKHVKKKDMEYIMIIKEIDVKENLIIMI